MPSQREMPRSVNETNGSIEKNTITEILHRALAAGECVTIQCLTEPTPGEIMRRSRVKRKGKIRGYVPEPTFKYATGKITAYKDEEKEIEFEDLAGTRFIISLDTIHSVIKQKKF